MYVSRIRAAHRIPFVRLEIRQRQSCFILLNVGGWVGCWIIYTLHVHNSHVAVKIDIDCLHHMFNVQSIFLGGRVFVSLVGTVFV